MHGHEVEQLLHNTWDGFEWPRTPGEAVFELLMPSYFAEITVM